MKKFGCLFYILFIVVSLISCIGESPSLPEIIDDTSNHEDKTLINKSAANSDIESILNKSKNINLNIDDKVFIIDFKFKNDLILKSIDEISPIVKNSQIDEAKLDELRLKIQNIQDICTKILNLNPSENLKDFKKIIETVFLKIKSNCDYIKENPVKYLKNINFENDLKIINQYLNNLSIFPFSGYSQEEMDTISKMAKNIIINKEDENFKNIFNDKFVISMSYFESLYTLISDINFQNNMLLYKDEINLKIQDAKKICYDVLLLDAGENMKYLKSYIDIFYMSKLNELEKLEAYKNDSKKFDELMQMNSISNKSLDILTDYIKILYNAQVLPISDEEYIEMCNRAENIILTDEDIEFNKTLNEKKDIAIKLFDDLNLKTKNIKFEDLTLINEIKTKSSDIIKICDEIINLKPTKNLEDAKKLTDIIFNRYKEIYLSIIENIDKKDLNKVNDASYFIAITNEYLYKLNDYYLILNKK